MKTLKLYPYHTLLFIPFIVVFLYAHNLNLTKPYMTYRTLWLGTLISLSLFGAFYLFFKNRLKAGVMVTIVLFTLFQYGIVYEFLESLYYRGQWPFKNIHRYLTSAFIVIYLTTFFIIKRTRHDFIKINTFLNVLISLLLLYNFAKLFVSSYPATGTGAAANNAKEENIVFDKSRAKPDIYYIILDGYASNLVLLKYFKYQNKEFTLLLKKAGFRFCDSAFSNYYYTSSSLAATLNFKYRDSSESESQLIRDNRLFRTLQKNGYDITHMKSGYAVTSFFTRSNKTIAIEGPNEFEKSLLKHTILRLDDLIGLFAHQRLTSQFEKLNELTVPSKNPTFNFLHIVAPHPPFIFDRNGKQRTKHQFAEHSWEPKECYVDQLIYVNKKILRFVSEIITKNPNAIIVIQSDHGPWIKAHSVNEVFEARSQMLFAYYAPDNVKIPVKTSAVNTFRYLFNGQFNCRLDTLPDLYMGKAALLKDPILMRKAE